MISVCFQGKPFNIRVIQAYVLTSNAEEAEVEWFYEDLQDLLELTPTKDVLFIIEDWNAKAGSQETPGSVQFSRLVVSDSLLPHGLQYARHPCPLPTPGVYSNSCPPGVTSKFGLGVQNETGERQTELCQDNALGIENTLFQQNK